MSELVNLTPFAASCLPSMTRDDEQLTLVVVSARFELPPAGGRVAAQPTLAADQGEVALADEPAGEPATSSLRREGQSTYTRPATDVVLWGHSYLQKLGMTPLLPPQPRVVGVGNREHAAKIEVDEELVEIDLAGPDQASVQRVVEQLLDTLPNAKQIDMGRSKG